MADPQIVLPAGRLQPRRLLDQIDRLPPVGTGNPDRWLDGVTWEPVNCDFTLTATEAVGQCGGSQDLLDLIPDPRLCSAWETQTPFKLIDAFSYSALDFTNAEVQDRLTASWDRLISAAFARELLGPAASMDRSLSSQAAAPAELAWGAAVTLRRAMAALESHLALTLQGTVGYIHVPPGLLAEAVYQYGLRLVGDHWETPAGNVVISDAGYAEPPTPNGFGATDAVDGEDWIYSSGPVFYASTAPTTLGSNFQTAVPDDPANFGLNRNRFLQWIEGYGILVFDDCGVSAAKASYTA